MLQPNLADHPAFDFRPWPPWRPLVAATATELARFTGQHLIAPQTVLVRAYLEQRIQGSGEAQAWRLDHLAEYRSSWEPVRPRQRDQRHADGARFRILISART